MTSLIHSKILMPVLYVLKIYVLTGILFMIILCT